MTTLKELIAQKESLEIQIAETRRRELNDAINRVKALIAEHELTAEDIFPSGKKKVAGEKKVNKVAAKYRDPITGNTWTGRGLAPKWLQGKDKAQFLIV